MEHQQYKEWLLLSLYDELTEADALALKQHLSTCDVCPKELEELKKLHATLGAFKPAPVEQTLLSEARAELRVALRAERTRRPWWQDAVDAVAELFTPKARLAFGTVAVLAIGIGLGYVAFRQPLEPDVNGLQTISSRSDAAFEQGVLQITNVRFINRDEANGEVEFTFDAVTPVHIKGNANDERVQKMLARAILTEKNVGTRLRAVNFIGDQQKDQAEPPKVNKEVKDALITALKFDSNLGVKKEALRILQKYLPDPDITNAIIYILKYVNNTGLKIAAINSLDMSKFSQPNQDLLAMLQEKVDTDDNSYVRIKAKAALKEARQ
jgi:hypothetical protein